MPLPYPPTRQVSQTDTYHGITVADPYRWLEDPNAEETAQWVEAQNKVTFDYLNQLPGRDQTQNPPHRTLELRTLRHSVQERRRQH